MVEVRKTEVFQAWLDGLRDVRARARVLVRIERLVAGNPGDVKPVGDGVSELRIDYGAGYRVYFIQRGLELIGRGRQADAGRGHHRCAKAGSSASEENMKKTTKTTKYDVAEHLRTTKEMSAYLEATLAEADGDPALIAKALGDIARARGMTEIARHSGLSRESLYKALSGDRVPDFGTILRVLKALGLELHVSAAR